MSIHGLGAFKFTSAAPNIGCQTMAYRFTNFWIGLTLHRLNIINSIYIYIHMLSISMFYISIMYQISKMNIARQL